MAISVDQIDQELDGIAEPTAQSLRSAIDAVNSEQRALRQLRTHIDGRLARLDQLRETLDGLLEGSLTSTSSVRSARNGQASTTDLIIAVLRDADKPLEAEAITKALSRVGHDVDPRGVGGALSAGARKGRFRKTRGGRWRLP